MLSTLVRSLYTTFLVEQDGYLFLNENFIDRTDGTIKFDPTLIAKFNQLEGIVSGVFDTLITVYSDDPNNQTFQSIKQAVIQFRAFTQLFREGEYGEYLLNPYVAVKQGTILAPKVSLETNSVIRGPGRTNNPTSDV